MFVNKEVSIGCFNVSNMTFQERLTSFTRMKLTRDDVLGGSSYSTDTFDYKMKDEAEKKKLNLYFWN